MSGRDERVKSSTVTEIDEDKALADPILTDVFAALRPLGRVRPRSSATSCAWR